MLYITGASCYRIVVRYPGGVQSGILGIGNQ
jgi:hypothetical protein